MIGNPPDHAEERRASVSRTVTNKHSSIGKELLDALLSDNLPFRVRKDLQTVVQLLQRYLRAAEPEMRAAEEPLQADLDVKGLKAQVLERIEEQGELLAELVPAMEARGYETQAVKAMMGGERKTLLAQLSP